MDAVDNHRGALPSSFKCIDARPYHFTPQQNVAASLLHHPSRHWQQRMEYFTPIVLKHDIRHSDIFRHRGILIATPIINHLSRCPQCWLHMQPKIRHDISAATAAIVASLDFQLLPHTARRHRGFRRDEAAASPCQKMATKPKRLTLSQERSSAAIGRNCAQTPRRQPARETREKGSKCPVCGADPSY